MSEKIKAQMKPSEVEAAKVTFARMVRLAITDPVNHLTQWTPYYFDVLLKLETIEPVLSEDAPPPSYLSQDADSGE